MRRDSCGSLVSVGDEIIYMESVYHMDKYKLGNVRKLLRGIIYKLCDKEAVILPYEGGDLTHRRYSNIALYRGDTEDV